MKYKVGDKVEVRKSDFGTEETSVATIIKVKEKEYVAENAKNMVIGLCDDMIDHEKTAELNKENYARYMEEQINDASYQALLKEMAEPVLDTVNHPSHYKRGEYEAIDVIKDIARDYSGYEGYLVGNIVKYLYRANYKDSKAEDMKKAQFYLNELVEVVDQ